MSARPTPFSQQIPSKSNQHSQLAKAKTRRESRKTRCGQQHAACQGPGTEHPRPWQASCRLNGRSSPCAPRPPLGPGRPLRGFAAKTRQAARPFAAS